MSDDRNPAKPKIDVRTLTLTQLKMLADKGSRRARAELEGRMRAMESRSSEGQGRASDFLTLPPTEPQPLSPSSPPSPPSPTFARPARPQPPATPPAARPVAPAPQAAAQAPAQAPRPAAAVPPHPVVQPSAVATPDADAALSPEVFARLESLRASAQQESSRSREQDPPRLVGMVLMGWGGLVGFGGLAMLMAGSMYRGNSLYYLIGGLLCGGVGWLLWRCSRMAMAAQAGVVILMLGWALGKTGLSGFFSGLAQAAPIWIPALWLLVPLLRDPLD